MKIIIWGIGRTERFIEPYLLESVHIEAFVDNNELEWDSCICIVRSGEYVEIPVIAPMNIGQFEFDYIMIAAAAYNDIKKQCIELLKIPADKIIQVFDLKLLTMQQVRRIFDINILADKNNFEIGNRHVYMDENHPLPDMQRSLMMYDRFVPFLAAVTKEKSNGDGIIIDIGANVGDTLMAMWDYTDDKFLCIEPTEMFWELLLKNTGNLTRGNRILYEKAIITDDASTGGGYETDVYTAGTAVKRKVKNGISDVLCRSLDDLLMEKGIPFENVDLIKIDTDGYDADCIFSGKNVIQEGNALVYWENAIFIYEQYDKYQRVYDLMEKAGYETFFIFDNCGNFMCEADIHVLRSLAGYLQRNNMDWSRITFHYIDVLGCKRMDIDKCRKAVESYLERYLLCRKKKK